MRFFKRILRFLKRIADKLFGTLADELYWRFRHFLELAWAKGYISPQSLGHPHRQLLVSRILAYAPLTTVLEVGCAAGANLYLLANQLPSTKFYGIDISPHAIRVGRTWLQSQGLNNVSLSVGKTEDLRNMPPQSIDIIFTDAVLIYIGPEKIGSVLAEMARVARKAFILVEWHTEDATSLYDGHWVHNYPRLISRIAPRADTRLVKLDDESWGPHWKRYGFLIEARP